MEYILVAHCCGVGLVCWWWYADGFPCLPGMGICLLRGIVWGVLGWGSLPLSTISGSCSIWFFCREGLLMTSLITWSCCRCLLLCWGIIGLGEVLSPLSRLFSLLEILYGCYMYLPYGFDACSREFVPFDCYISASLSCLWFVQGSLFPLISVQQACLAYVLFKGLCTLFLVLLVPNVFLIYNILTFDKKKSSNCVF
jgi:hypothetical protein